LPCGDGLLVRRIAVALGAAAVVLAVLWSLRGGREQAPPRRPQDAVLRSLANDLEAQIPRFFEPRR